MHTQGESRTDSASRDILRNFTEVCKLQPLLFWTWEGLESHLLNNSLHRSFLNCLFYIAALYTACSNGNEYNRYKFNTNVGLFFGNMNGTQILSLIRVSAYRTHSSFKHPGE